MHRGLEVGPAPATWVLLRGLSRSAAHWGDFPARLSATGLGEVLCIDLPGNGVHVDRPSPTTIAAMLADVRDQLAPVRASRPAARATVHGPLHVLALSMGGMLACEWALRWPQELASVVLVNSSLRGISPFTQRLRPSAWRALLPLLLTPASAQRWETTLHELTSARPESRAAVVAAWVELRRHQPVSRKNVLRQLLAAGRYAAPARPLGLPVLVLNGAADRLVDPRCSSALAARWSAQLHVHPRAGHDLPLDEPDWLLDRLVEWSASLPSSDQGSSISAATPGFMS
jgi:pimeloyl-ACP methyl ester carboxylesterase